MLQKKLIAGGKVEVTFRMPPIDDVVELNLCGDFNGWHLKGAPLVQESDGTWVTTLVLEAGKTYRYRYYDNQGSWHNDWEADSYLANEFGSEDSILDLTKAVKMPAKSRAAPKVAAKKPAAPKGGQARTKKTTSTRPAKPKR
jgi:1,4-alpha-glucan branching enzyme